MADYELAQLNIAWLKESLDSPVLTDFVANLDRINALAEQSDGFVWRFQSEDGNATAVQPLGDEVVINLSVWRDKASLHDYVYRSEHASFIGRRKEWFNAITDAYMVLWWVPAGHRPAISEALSKLNQLRSEGPGPEAFTFKKLWPAPH